MKRYTHDAQNDVADFHQAMGSYIPCHPGIRLGQLRIDLIEEEAKETCDAIKRGDLIEAIDGLCDLIYVAYGAAIEFGIDLAPFWNEVQRSNMAKRGGPKRADGKCMKPEGWTRPDIEGVLRKEYHGAS